jgi:uncharacterized protein YcbK (DUF882 family)
MALDPLGIIEQRESRGRNVPNYKYGPGFTASGYYQMIDATWRRWAKAAGVDISQYPTAMSAPKEVQRAVAAQGFKMEGFRPWEATKHLVGQEKDYSVEPQTQVAGVLGEQSPVTAAAVQRAKSIDEFRQMMSSRFPELQYTSGYRSPAANAAAGGAKGSQHMHNLAVDARLKNFDDAKRAEIYNYARQIGAQGIGYYPGSQSAHFDLRTGAPAAWGQNYSRTSLGATPPWFQQIAQQHLSGAPTTAIASSGATGGAPGGAGVGQLSATPTPPTPAKPPDLLQTGLQNIATALTGPPVEAATPMQAPEPTSPMSGPANQPDQGGAANMMAALLERKRSAYAPQQPGIFQTGVFA